MDNTVESLQACVNEYRQQLGKGVIQKAYQGLMEYVMDLRTQFSKKYPDFAPGNIYHGYMDMTYFPIFPDSLKGRKLKIGIVLIHATVQFEVWLLGYNKQVQTKYWTLFKERNYQKYRIQSTLKGTDSIVEFTLSDNPDFNNLDMLTMQIEKGTLQFVKDIENFLSRC